MPPRGKMRTIRPLTAAVICLMMAATLLCGCQETRVYDHYEHVSDNGWSRNDTLHFPVQRLFAGEYDVTLGLRLGHNYPYRNISLIVSYQTLPGGKTVADTVQLNVLNEKGQSEGRMGITSATVRCKIKELQTREGDSIHITVNHNMRREDLPGISDVGIQLQSAVPHGQASR